MADNEDPRTSEASGLDFICYDWPGELPLDLKPGNRRRQCLRETENGLAYKCLPLVMANQHCWEIDCPAAVEAEWDGGASL